MKKVLALLLCLWVGLAVYAKNIVLYHTSDTHGFFYPQNGQGGFAVLANLLKQEKNPYLLLDSGDFANGTAETKNSKGIKAVTLMNAMGYHATTVGNHEFDFKDAGIEPLLASAQFTVLAANMRDQQTHQLPAWAKAYGVWELEGVKVGIIGLANRTPTQPTKRYRFIKPLKALEQALADMQPQHPDVVVVLVHDSLADYKNGILRYVGEIGTKYTGRVHVVLGGHAHKQFQNEFIRGVLYAESGCYLKNVTRVLLELDDKTHQLKKASSSLIALEVSTWGEDPQIAQLAEQLKEPGMDEVLGTIAEPLSKNPTRPNEADSALDNWIAQIGKQYSGADLFIHNTGGTRISLFPGAFTRRTLIDLFPFDDYLVQFTLTGTQLKNFIRKGLLPWNKYVYAGLHIQYQVKRGKIKALEVFLGDTPIQNRALYTVATNSYVARHPAFAKLTDKKTVGTKKMRQLIEEELQKGPVVSPKTGTIQEK